MFLGGGGLPAPVNQEVQANMAQNSAQQDTARLTRATPGQVNPGDPQLVQAVERFSQPGELFNYRYEFKMDNKLRRPVVQVIDKKTGDQLYEIPPETIVRMLDDLMTKGSQGALVDRKI